MDNMYEDSGVQAEDEHLCSAVVGTPSTEPWNYSSRTGKPRWDSEWFRER
jgi:hypothetical protein